MAYKAFKYRLKLNNTNKRDLSNHFGSTRWIYNHFLYNIKNNKYNQIPSISTLNKNITKLKELHHWLSKTSIMSLQAAVINLTDAFKKMKIGAGYPQFKRKYDTQSCRFNNATIHKNTYPIDTIRINFNTHKIIIPKLGQLNFYRSNSFKGKIISATITKEPDNNYYISIIVNENITKLNPIQKEIGADLGINNYLITSDNTTIQNPKYYRKYKKILKKQQRKLSKKKLNSKRYNKQKLIVAKLHKKIANHRKDFLHKLSTKLINENQVIALETLAVKNMLKNHKLALSISDAAWGEFVRQLTYKAEWYGRTILRIDTFEPSSKMCHRCGHINKDLQLKDREWTCDNCHVHHDRDYNASVNILCIAKCPDIEDNKSFKKGCKFGQNPQRMSENGQ